MDFNVQKERTRRTKLEMGKSITGNDRRIVWQQESCRSSIKQKKQKKPFGIVDFRQEWGK